MDVKHEHFGYWVNENHRWARCYDCRSQFEPSPAHEQVGLYRPLAANAADLGAMAACKHGQAQWYRATLERRGFAAVATLVRAAARDGNLVPLTAYPDPPPFVAAIDVLDSNGDIVQNYSVSTDAAWTWWMTAAEMRLTESDCRICDPIVWLATDPIRRSRESA